MAHAGLLARIRREFQDHPGIVLTFPQVLRLWSLEERDGTEALDALVAEGFLQRIDDLYVCASFSTTPHGARCRAHGFAIVRRLTLAPLPVPP
jgi:hypothetical protein